MGDKRNRRKGSGYEKGVGLKKNFVHSTLRSSLDTTLKFFTFAFGRSIDLIPILHQRALKPSPLSVALHLRHQIERDFVEDY